MEHVFSAVPSIDTPRSVFRRPFTLKTTIDVDYLYPIYCDEVLPADTVKMHFKLFGRLTTPIVPIMDNLYLDVHFFAVPNRLIDKDWKKLMGERPFGDLDIPVTAPKLNTGDGIAVGSLSDYIGIPPNVKNLDFLPYWHRAYNLIWNEWYRPEYICPAVKVAGVAEDGTVSAESLDDYVLLKRGKRLDYFTGCNPFPQVGDGATIGLTGQIPIYGNGQSLGLQGASSGNQLMGLYVDSPATTNYNSILHGFRNAYDKPLGTTVSSHTETYNGVVGLTTDASKSGIVGDLSDASSVSINALRQAFATQHFLEALARSGSRYIEILRGIFNVISPDARMQRPEYLGGTSTPLEMLSVPQTSASAEGSTPQGYVGAFSVVSAEGFWSKSFTEHCVIIGLANIRADVSYQQGLNRMFSRSTRFDWYLPQFANIGEQAVLQKELKAHGANVLDDDGNLVDDSVFGYQEAWAEYRYHPDMITGKMRSSINAGLGYWHLAENYTGTPTLSPDFVLQNTPIDRCLAVQDEPDMILSGAFDSEWARPMPVYSVPGLRRL